MGVVRRERASYTFEQVEAAVRDTVKVCDTCGLSDADRRALLPAIFDKVAAKEVTYEQLGGLGGLELPRPQG